VLLTLAWPISLLRGTRTASDVTNYVTHTYRVAQEK